MGCDIHSFCEVRRDGRWDVVGDVFPLDKWERDYRKKDRGHEPFNLRNYSLFGFLADVRNYAALPPLAVPRGLPEDISSLVRDSAEHWDADGHSHSWFSLAELLAFDYSAAVEDRRYTKQVGPNAFDGGATAPAGSGVMTTWREELPDVYFAALDIMKTLGAPDDVRVVFWFDN